MKNNATLSHGISKVSIKIEFMSTISLLFIGRGKGKECQQQQWRHSHQSFEPMLDPQLHYNRAYHRKHSQ